MKNSAFILILMSTSVWASPTPVETAPTASTLSNPTALARAEIKQIIRPMVKCTINAGQVYSHDNGLEDSGDEVPVELTFEKNLSKKVIIYPKDPKKPGAKKEINYLLALSYPENDVKVDIEVLVNHDEIKPTLGQSLADQLTGIANIVIKKRNQEDKYDIKAKHQGKLSNESPMNFDTSLGPVTNGEYRKATVNCIMDQRIDQDTHETR